MMVTLRLPTLEECQQQRIWRNAPDVLPMLRTDHPLTEAEQEAFFADVIQNPAADHKYWAVDVDGEFCGLGGLTYLSRTPGDAEISLVLGPQARGRGIGSAAVDALVAEAWVLGLSAVVGECYAHGAMGFWVKQMPRQSPRWFETDAAGTLRWRWEKP